MLALYEGPFDWFRGTVAEMVFLTIAIAGGVYCAFSIVLGGHGDADHDTGGDHHGDMSSYFSLRSVAWFATGFGSVGFITYWLTKKEFVSSVAGALAGFAMSAFGIWLINRFKGQQASSMLSADDFVNLHGEVATMIPPSGIGEVSLSVRGRLVTRMAKSEDNATLPAGSLVKVTRTIGDYLLVQKIS